MAKSLLKYKILFAEGSQGFSQGLMSSVTFYLEMIHSFAKQGVRRQGNIHFKSACQYSNFFIS